MDGLANISVPNLTASALVAGGRTSRASNSSTEFSKSLAQNNSSVEDQSRLGSPVGFMPQAPDSSRSVIRGDSVAAAPSPVTPAPTSQTDTKVAKRALDESVDNLAQRQALQQFIRRMQEEFGIDAEQILQALATLTPQELVQPPQANLQKILDSLPLDDAQKIKAKGYFEEMLRQGANTSFADYLRSSRRQLSLEVLSRDQARSRSLNQNVADIQGQFFRTQPPVQSAKQPENSAQNQSLTSPSPVASAPNSQSLAAPIFMGDSASAVSAPASAPTSLPSSLPASVPTSLASSLPTSLPASVSSVSVASDSVAPVAGQDVLPQPEVAPVVDAAKSASGWKAYGLPAQPSVSPQATNLLQADVTPNPALNSPVAVMPQTRDAAQVDLPEEFFPQAAKGLAPREPVGPALAAVGLGAQAVAGAGAGDSATLDLFSDSEDSGSEADLSGSDFMVAPEQRLGTNATEGVSLKNTSFMIPTQPSQSEQAANVRELVQQAQFLAKKGGGEMKVEMSPEGLGQVSLKVAVQGGQVNVEMITESREVKKLLEKGLGDLKSTLASHNLKIDQIRIETPADVSKQLTERHDEAQRQFAQQFMEQFRQDNQEWRRGFFDIPGAKLYRSQREEAERTQPGDVNGQRRRDQTRRLDLVA